jgi:hypothetical protein
MGMGKAILLKSFLQHPCFSSKNHSELGVVRMHEFETCEILLLRGSDSSTESCGLQPKIPALIGNRADSAKTRDHLQWQNFQHNKLTHPQIVT